MKTYNLTNSTLPKTQMLISQTETENTEQPQTQASTNENTEEPARELPIIEETIVTLQVVRMRRVTWTLDTVNNEHMNRKKSKVCCIRHVNDENKHVNKYERM